MVSREKGNPISISGRCKKLIFRFYWNGELYSSEERFSVKKYFQAFVCNVIIHHVARCFQGTIDGTKEKVDRRWPPYLPPKFKVPNLRVSCLNQGLVHVSVTYDLGSFIAVPVTSRGLSL